MLLAVSLIISGLLPQALAFADGAAAVSPTVAASGSSSAGAAPHARAPFEFIAGSVQFFLVGLFILWMLYLRPMQKREETQRKFLSQLKKNDDVITSGGIYGKVFAVKPDEVTIEVSPNVKLRIKPDHLYPIVTTQGETKGSPLQIAGKEQGR